MPTFGGVFGLGFAIEGFSFFLEAIFIGIYLYGWNRLSPRAHLLTGIPIVLAGFTGSLMVISVNAWMQHPSGFRASCMAEPSTCTRCRAVRQQLPLERADAHVRRAYIVAGFLLAMPYAIARLRKYARSRYERTAFAIPLTIAAVASPVQILVGDWAARDVATEQPTKLAAIEGLSHTTRGARRAYARLVREGQVKFGIAIPKLLSLLAFHNPDATVQGLDAVPARSARRSTSCGSPFSSWS